MRPIQLFSLYAAAALTCLFGAIDCTSAQVEFFSQNWTDEERQTFYTTTQGSRMMPYDWFIALEMEDSDDSFLKQLPKLGYIPNDNSTDNPDKLPVGFVQDENRINGDKYIGLTCAACHTHQIEFDEKTYQIDGGSTLADMWGLLEGMDNSLKATREDDEKFKRFADKVLGSSAPISKHTELKSEVDKFLVYWSQFIDDSRAEHPWGRGRLDDFGMIFNRVASIDLEIPSNSRTPNAPVSYPSLWGTSFHDFVQWNASARNGNDIERLGRNIGEVLGVFAQAQFQPPTNFLEIPRPARTSAHRLNLVKLENQIKKLWAPRWEEHFGELDADKVKAGRELYVANCIKCHEVVPFNEQDTPVEIRMVPVSKVLTDRKMAVNAATGLVSTGPLRKVFDGREKVPRGELLKKAVRLALISPYRDVADEAGILERLRTDDLFDPSEIKKFTREIGFGKPELERMVKANQEKLKEYYSDLKASITSMKATPPESSADVPPVLVYKAAPLAGIWATAPYLHNGSVPNLYELLSPVEERTANFHVGSKKLDAKKVGFDISAGEGTTAFDTSKPGNTNVGHDMYGTFSEEERWQLIEYLKSL